MAFDFEEIEGGDISFEPAGTVRRWRSTGAPAALPGGDFFSFVASVALAKIPATYFVPALGLLYRQDIQIHENYYALDYALTVPYGRRKRETGAYQITVDQTGGSVHVTAGTRISGWGPDGGGLTDDTEPAEGEGKVDNGGLIGVDGEEIHGVDIPVEETKITVSFRHPQGQLNAEYVKRIGRLVGYPNNDEFLTYEPGEVLYLGGNFTETETEATAQYNFAISYNIKEDDAFTVGGISIDEKKGWDVLSPTYKKDTDNGFPVRKVQYIEIIRPAGREWKDYGTAEGFGWGGTGEEE